jgi:hypothetical protein
MLSDKSLQEVKEPQEKLYQKGSSNLADLLSPKKDERSPTQDRSSKIEKGLKKSDVDLVKVGKEMGRLLERNRKFFETADKLGIDENYLLVAYKDIIDNAVIY